MQPYMPDSHGGARRCGHCAQRGVQAPAGRPGVVQGGEQGNAAPQHHENPLGHAQRTGRQAKDFLEVDAGEQHRDEGGEGQAEEDPSWGEGLQHYPGFPVQSVPVGSGWLS